MAGHSHWAGIKHKKGLLDKKRGKLFSKLAKNIMGAVKEGGGDIDPNSNLRLRYAIDKAKEANMPKNNIERAINKAAGLTQGGSLELLYEGYGSGGVAVMAEVITDNRNRTAFELRKLYEDNKGKLGESGCVAYLFEKKGILTVPLQAIEEEALMDLVLEAGAEDMKTQDDTYQITTAPGDLETVRKTLEESNIEIESAEVTMYPNNEIELDEENARAILQLISALEEHEDVGGVHSNHKISDEIMAKIESEEEPS